ncbi:MAG: cytochrome c [bacterium]|nr:cytochrome c [bacterium]
MLRRVLLGQWILVVGVGIGLTVVGCRTVTPGGECSSDADCPTGEQCRANQCVPIVIDDCQEDADCADGEVCTDGECVDAAPVPECAEDVDCADGEVCTDGECVDAAPEPECEEDVDCADGEVCTEGECVEAAPEPECEEDVDCADGEVCTEGECVEAAVDGAALYADNCAACHGAAGNDGFAPDVTGMDAAALTTGLESASHAGIELTAEEIAAIETFLGA